MTYNEVIAMTIIYGAGTIVAIYQLYRLFCIIQLIFHELNYKLGFINKESYIKREAALKEKNLFYHLEKFIKRKFYSKGYYSRI